MVCQATEDHVEMNTSHTGSEAALIGDQWPRMKSNTYIKGEGIRELRPITSQRTSGIILICCFLIPHKAALSQRKTGSSFSQIGFISDL